VLHHAHLLVALVPAELHILHNFALSCSLLLANALCLLVVFVLLTLSLTRPEQCALVCIITTCDVLISTPPPATKPWCILCSLYSQYFPFSTSSYSCLPGFFCLYVPGYSHTHHNTNDVLCTTRVRKKVK